MGRQPVGVLQHAPGSESNLRHDIFRFKDSQTICAGGNFESQAPQEGTSILPRSFWAQELRPEPDHR